MPTPTTTIRRTPVIGRDPHPTIALLDRLARRMQETCSATPLHARDLCTPRPRPNTKRHP